MRVTPTRGDLQLYLTGEHDCSYIDGLQARTLFVDPLAMVDGQRAQWLQQIGFRRSGQHFYRPACRGCQRCVPVRVRSRTFSRIARSGATSRATTATSSCWRDPPSCEPSTTASTSAIC
jgi:arginyl-tRNA--protein-N-Asp/Glu arginylyltransferase